VCDWSVWFEEDGKGWCEEGLIGFRSLEWCRQKKFQIEPRSWMVSWARGTPCDLSVQLLRHLKFWAWE